MASEQLYLAKRNFLCKQLALSEEITIDELLELAIKEESFCRQLGALDLAFEYFKQTQLRLEELAYVIEKLQSFQTKAA